MFCAHGPQFFEYLRGFDAPLPGAGPWTGLASSGSSPKCAGDVGSTLTAHFETPSPRLVHEPLVNIPGLCYSLLRFWILKCPKLLIYNMEARAGIGRLSQCCRHLRKRAWRLLKTNPPLLATTPLNSPGVHFGVHEPRHIIPGGARAIIIRVGTRKILRGLTFSRYRP